MNKNCIKEKEINSSNYELIFQQFNKPNTLFAEKIEKEFLEKVKSGGIQTGLEEKQFQNFSTKITGSNKKKRIKYHFNPKKSIITSKKREKSESKNIYFDDGVTQDTPPKNFGISINAKKENNIKEFLEDKKIEEKDNLIKNEVKINNNNFNNNSLTELANKENNNNINPNTINNIIQFVPEMLEVSRENQRNSNENNENSENNMSISDQGENQVNNNNINHINIPINKSNVNDMSISESDKNENLPISEPINNNINNYNDIHLFPYDQNHLENNNIYENFYGYVQNAQENNTDNNENENVLIYNDNEPNSNINVIHQNPEDTSFESFVELNDNNNFYNEAEEIYDAISEVENNILLNQNNNDNNDGDDIFHENQIEGINANNIRNN